MRLHNKIALIFGAGQGQGTGMGNGRATAITYAREGATVVAIDRDIESAEETATMARAKGERAFTGDGVVGGRQQVRSSLPRRGGRTTLTALLRNNGARPDQLAWTATNRGPFRLLRPRSGVTPVLQPGGTWTVKLKVLRPASLGDGRRVRILRRLVEGNSTLDELAEAVGLARSTTHHHLTQLRAAGLVTLGGNARGYWYALRPEGLTEAQRAIGGLALPPAR